MEILESGPVESCTRAPDAPMADMYFANPPAAMMIMPMRATRLENASLAIANRSKANSPVGESAAAGLPDSMPATCAVVSSANPASRGGANGMPRC